MTRLTKLQCLIVAELADQRGHGNWEIAKTLAREKGDLKRTIDLLEGMNLIYRGASRQTTNLRSKRPRQPEIPFFIKEDLDVFASIVRAFIRNEEQQRLIQFLSSNYTNNIIIKSEFSRVCGTLEREFFDPDFNKAASKSLLGLASTKEEYEKYGSSISKFVLDHNENIMADIIDYLSNKNINLKEIFEPYVLESSKRNYESGSKEHMKALKEGLAPLPLGKLEILSKLDPLHTVMFFRRTINKELEKIYHELVARSAISNSVKDFLMNDNHLSPMTSYPANSPLQLLFLRPFQRIYEDTFVLGEDDLSRMIDRCYVLYDSFVDFLVFFFREENLPQETIKTLTRELMFYWNVSSSGFDIIFKYLYNFYLKDMGSGKFHVKSDGLKLQIFDLETGKPMLHDFTGTSLPAFFSYPYVSKRFNGGKIFQVFMDSPFEYLRPSNIFENNKPKSELVPIEEILSSLEHRIK